MSGNEKVPPDLKKVVADTTGFDTAGVESDIGGGAPSGPGGGSDSGAPYGPAGTDADQTGTSTDEGPPATVTLIDTTTGQQYTGTYNPDTGAYETTIEDTTVIQQTSTPASSPDGTGPDDTSISGPDPTTPQQAGAGIPFHIDPDSFKFRPVAENWQETKCTPITFSYGSMFLPPIVIRVGVIVGAPRVYGNGHRVSVREAQLTTATGAEVAANEILALLDAGTIDPGGQVQRIFTGLLGGALQPEGYRVNGCFPG